MTCNRRLGAEGFLYLEELVGDGIGPGNLGIQDLGFVLQWVQKNISNFGGDPNNVTLFGESGGGAAVHALLATGGSEGLFHRIISQSGGHAAQRPDTATAIAERVLNHVGIRAGDIDKLQSLPWQTLVEAYDLIDEQALGRPQIYLPVINQHMPIHPVDASFEGIGHSIDYLIGHCRDEARLFSAILPSLEDSVFIVGRIKSLLVVVKLGALCNLPIKRLFLTWMRIKSVLESWATCGSESRVFESLLVTQNLPKPRPLSISLIGNRH